LLGNAIGARQADLTVLAAAADLTAAVYVGLVLVLDQVTAAGIAADRVDAGEGDAIGGRGALLIGAAAAAAATTVDVGLIAVPYVIRAGSRGDDADKTRRVTGARLAIPIGRAVKSFAARSTGTAAAIDVGLTTILDRIGTRGVSAAAPNAGLGQAVGVGRASLPRGAARTATAAVQVCLLAIEYPVAAGGWGLTATAAAAARATIRTHGAGLPYSARFTRSAAV
jgi:hypothetical protein